MKHIFALPRFSWVAKLAFSVIFVSTLNFAYGQTVVLNDATVLRSNTKRAGLNLGALDYYDTGQILKNLIGSLNPGFEPVTSQQIWALTDAGTTTSFTDPDAYDTVPANYWTGSTFTVVASQNNGAEMGCTGTIASNTGPNYPNENNTPPVFTMSKACAAPFAAGDIVIFKKAPTATPESWWENNQAGFWTNVSGGGKLLSDTTDLCATCGSQALQMNASASGSSATINAYYDSDFTANLFVLMNGTYQISFWAKAAAGSPSLFASAARLSAGGFNCGTFTPALTSTWTQFTFNCKASETQATTTPGTAQVSFSVSGGSVDLDNVSFAKTSGSATNTTAFRDEVITAIQNYFGTTSGGNPGVLRDWLGQNGETMDNWSKPNYAHGPTAGGALYYDGPGGGGSQQLSLEDFLIICQFVHAEPYLEVPVTFTTQDAAALIEFLAGPSSSTYGARRVALGQSAPWTSVFSQIHLSFCNECWNGATFPGQSLPWRSNQPANEFLFDYSVRARDIFAAMRADTYYSAPAFDLILNAQTAVNWGMDSAIARSHPDSIEIEDYTYGNVNDTSSDAALWGPAMVEPWDKVIDPNDPSNFYTSVTDYQGQKECGAAGSSTCNVNVYEWGQGTVNGSIDQTHLDYINAGAGEGPVAVLEPLLNLQYFGILNNSYFSLAEFNNGTATTGGGLAKLWGNTVDMGGATNNMRPQFLALSLMNQSMIGPMYSCPISNNATYNFAGNASNGTSVPPGIPELSNVPYVYAFCFENGTKRSLVLVNTDLTNSHSLSFSGTHPPSGTVTERQYAPSSLNAMNETPTGTPTNTAKATVVLTSTTLTNPTSVSLPPHSVIALDYTSGVASTQPQAAMPTISPASGSYTSAVSVTIADATKGAAIHYTMDGSTPTASSATYSAPVTVSATNTVKAIAVATGDLASPVATATYTVSSTSGGTVATPTISPAGGTYSGAQSVTIKDATKGATIHYTTNGSTPTASSATYSAAFTVSATETVKAIAVLSGSSNSAVATASFTVGSSSPGGPTGTPTYPSGITSGSLALNGSAKITNSLLELTDGGFSEASSAWYGAKVPISSFTTDFTFQSQNAVADGFTFTIQNDGVKAIGKNGGSLGYSGLSNSVGLKFDLFSNAGEGTDSTGIYRDGVAPTLPAINLSSTGINLHSSDVFHAHLVYNGTVLTMTLTDTNTGAATTQQFTVNIPATVGATTAYIGFTGGTGGSSATQTIKTWTFTNSSTTAAATPAISPAGGNYSSAQKVTITDATKNAKVYYTTDGSSPTSSSKLYSGPLTVSASETVRAIAVASGFSNSSIASAAYSIGATGNLPNFPKGMTASNLALNGSAQVTSGALVLTDGGYSEAGSAWYGVKVPVSQFTTDFTFKTIATDAADGFTFAIQADGVGAIGGDGMNLGYGGLHQSIALKFDLYSNDGEGPNSTGVYQNGAIPTQPSTDLSASGINFHSGDVFDAHVVYDGTTLTLAVTDTQTKATTTKKFTINIPGVIGSSTAYVGFTGGTGGNTAIQGILTWLYSASVTTADNVSAEPNVTATSPAKMLEAAVEVPTNTNGSATIAKYVDQADFATSINPNILATNGVGAVRNGALQLTSGGLNETASAQYPEGNPWVMERIRRRAITTL